MYLNLFFKFLIEHFNFQWHNMIMYDGSKIQILDSILNTSQNGNNEIFFCENVSL